MKTFGLPFRFEPIEAIARRSLVPAAAAVAMWVMAPDASASGPGDVLFDFAAGGTSHFTINGSSVNVAIAGGRASLTIDDGPCTTGPDGESLCGVTVNHVALLLTDFTAGGHTFGSGIIQTLQPVHLFASNGQMTIPAGTPGGFGAAVDGARSFATDVTPAALTLTVNLSAQQATMSGSFFGTSHGATVNVGFSDNAVSPFTNLPPVVNAGPDATVHGYGPLIAVPLSGTVTDPGGGSLTGADWLENGAVVAQGANTTAMLAPGTHTLTLEASDTFGGLSTDSVVVQVAPGMTIGPAGNRLQYFYCAQEGGTCALTGKKYVAYGANGQFVFQAVTGSVACTNSFFGADPAVGLTKSCYFTNYGLDVGEGGTGRAPPGGVEVAYGANGVFTFGHFVGAYACSNATFGDPLPGVVKACYQAVPGFSAATVDFGTLSNLSNTWVAYGANGLFTFKVLSGTVPCLPSTFGYDPAVGVLKTCYVEAVGRPIASEGQSLNWSGPVLYGSGLDGNFLIVNSSGPLGCNNATFGGDPHIFLGKICYGLPVIP